MDDFSACPADALDSAHHHGIIFVDTESGDYGERRLGHPEEAEALYRYLAARAMFAPGTARPVTSFVSHGTPIRTSGLCTFGSRTSTLTIIR